MQGVWISLVLPTAPFCATFRWISGTSCQATELPLARSVAIRTRSQALCLRLFRLAGTLVAAGASPATALLETGLLECSRFDPGLVRWLLDAGADVTVPAHHSPRTCVASGGSSSAVATVLGKAG